MTITVLGFGSLLSKKSALETVPKLENFQIVDVPGYRRIFNKVGVVFFERYGLRIDDQHVASCVAQKHESHTIKCAAFECSDEVTRSISHFVRKTPAKSALYGEIHL